MRVSQTKIEGGCLIDWYAMYINMNTMKPIIRIIDLHYFCYSAYNILVVLWLAGAHVHAHVSEHQKTLEHLIPSILRLSGQKDVKTRVNSSSWCTQLPPRYEPRPSLLSLTDRACPVHLLLLRMADNSNATSPWTTHTPFFISAITDSRSTYSGRYEPVWKEHASSFSLSFLWQSHVSIFNDFY